MLFKKQAVHDAWAATDRTLDFKIVIKDKTYTAADITNLTFDSGAMNGAALTIGSTYQNTIKITFSHLIEGLELLDEVTPQIGIRLPDGTWDFTNLGVFVLDSEVVQDRNNNTTTLSASDRMCMLGGTYESKLTYPAPISDIAIEAANLSGVKINEADFARIPNTEINSFGSVTYRDAIGYIAQFAGGFATFDRDGLLDVRTLSDPNFVISPAQYQSKGLSKNESFYRIGGITCTVTTITKDESGNEIQETKTLQAGSSSGTQIALINPSMTQVLLDGLYQQLQDINFYPFSLSWFGDPSLEVGDWITIKDTAGNEFKTPNLLYSLTFGGGLSAVSKADTTVTSSASFVYKGQLSQDVENIRQHMNASGNIVSEGIDPPSNPKPGDIWFAKDGPDTIIKTWVIDPETGIGSWQEQVSTKPDEKLQESVDNAVKDAADALDKSNTAVTDANKAVEDAGFANNTANDAKASADDATNKAAEALNDANNALTNASQAQKDANTATGKAEDAISAANKAQGDATNAINNAQDALDKYNNLKSGNRNYLLNTAKPFEADWNNTTSGNQLFFLWNYSGGGLKDNGFNPGELALLEYDWEISNVTTYSEFAVYFESTPLTIVSSTGTKGNATTTVAPSESVTSGHVTVLVKWKDAVETNTQTKIKAYCVPGFAAHIKISNAILAKRNVPGDWSPAPEDVETEITNINGELSQKVSQTEYNNLKGTVENNSTQITQNQHDIQLKANQTQVDTINKTVQNQQTEINQNASQIELKADKTVTDQINKDVASNSANIKLNSDQIKLKANQSTVDNLTGRVTDAEGKLTIQADQIAQTVSKTELDNTLGKYATQTWTQGQIKTTADNINLSVSKVQSDVDGLSVGGRNYLLDSASPMTFIGKAITNQYDHSSDKLFTFGALKDIGKPVGMSVEFGFDVEVTGTEPAGTFLMQHNAAPWQSNIGTKTYNVADYLGKGKQRIIISASVIDSWLATSATATGFGARLDNVPATITITFTNFMYEFSNKPSDWSPAPEDMASATDYANLEIKVNGIQGTVANKADQSQVTQLADQITSTVGNIGQTNLIYNSEYDNNAEGWNISNGYSTNAPGSMYQGSLGWAINSTGDNWIQFAQSKPYKLPNTSSTDASNVYSMSTIIKIYNDTTIGAGAGVTLAFLNANGSRIAGWKDNMVYAATGTTNVWTQIKFEGMRVPDGAVSVVLQYQANRKTGGKVHAVVVHPMLTFGPTIGPYQKDSPSQSQITQMKDDINLRVQKGDVINQINISPESILIAGQKVHITGQTTIDNAVIKDAMIANLSASKLTAGTIDAGKINVVNLNASNITTGTITGSNLSINLNTGEILFTKGSIKSTNGKLNINVDDGTFAQTDTDGSGVHFEHGGMYLGDKSFLWSDSDTYYGFIRAMFSLDGDDQKNPAMYIQAKNGLSIGTENSVNIAGSRGSGSKYTAKKAVLFSEGMSVVTGGDSFLSADARIGVSGKYPGGGSDWTINDSTPGTSVYLRGSSLIFNAAPGSNASSNFAVATDANGYLLSMTTYKRTYSSGANMTVTANGVFGRISSASKYKLDISTVSNITEQAHAFLAVEPKQWFDKSETEDMAKELTEGDSGSVDSANVRPYYGYVAEDLYSAGLDNVVLRDSNTGELEGIQYDRLTIYHHELIRELYQRVNDLETKIYLMEANK